MKSVKIVFVAILFILGFVVHDQENVMCASAILGGLSAAIGLGTSIFGGSKARRERKKQQKELDKQKAENDILFNKEYYQDYMQRSENQALLKNLRDRLKRDNQAAAQTAVVTGATPEAVAKQKELSNTAYADAASQIASNNSNVRDRVMSQYLGMKDRLYGRQNEMYGTSAQQWSNLMQNGLDAFGGSVGSLVESLGKK